MPSAVKTNPTLVVIRPDAFDVSPPLRTVDISVAPRPTVRPELERVLPRSGPIAPAPDPVVQTTARALMPEPLKSFEGIKNLDNVVSVDPLIGPVIPPDVEGDVGPNDYVEYVNLAWSVYDKSSGAPRPGFPKPNGAIWAGFADETCRDEWSGDPIVLYDQAANRWLLSEFAFRSTSGGPAGPYKICVAVSTSGDPTGSYARYAYSAFGGFPDYPKFGIWPDGYYMSVNLFGFPFKYAGAGAAAFDRIAMLAANPSATMIFFDTNDPSRGGMLPADWESDLPPQAGEPNIFMQFDDDNAGATADRLQVWKFHADFANPGSSTFTNTGNITVGDGLAPFNSDICCIPHPLVTHELSALADRLMHRLQYRRFPNRQTLVVNHTVNAGQGKAGVRWYELRLDSSFNPSIVQQGTFAPGDEHRWMGSAAMDSAGNIAVGYSVSSATTFPSIRYAGRLSTDPPGELSQGEATLHAGTGTQASGTFGAGGAPRWGDYTALQVDPVDECTFWYVNEYYPVTHDWQWHTRIGSFRFPQCGLTTAVDISRFGAHWSRGGVVLRWRSTTENSAVGFHVWRSGAKGSWRRVNRGLIRAKHPGTARGAAYRFVDRTARTGRFYSYRLQVVDLEGKRNWYGVGSTPSR